MLVVIFNDDTFAFNLEKLMHIYRKYKSLQCKICTINLTSIKFELILIITHMTGVLNFP